MFIGNNCILYNVHTKEPPEEKTEDVANAGAGKFVASSLLFSNAAKASGFLFSYQLKNIDTFH